MFKFWIIMKREYAQVVKKKSFVVGLVLTPVLMVAFMLLPAMLATKDVSKTESVAVLDQSGLEIGPAFAKAIEHYRISDSETPSYDTKAVFTVAGADSERFEELNDSLTQEVADEAIKYVLVARPGAEKNDSSLYLITNSTNFRALSRFEYQLSQILASHRLKQSNINLPVDSVLALTERIDLATRDTKGESIPFMVKYFTGFIFVMLMFSMILNYGQTMMRSVIEEKNSRIMEVLVSSVTPFQLMLGKVTGLGAAAFTQIAIWVLAGLAIFFSSSALALNIDQSISRMVFNPLIVVSFVVFFIVGYLMYSTIFALVGSIVNSDKEAQNFLFPVTMALIMPVFIGMAVIQDPYAPWVLALTYIPLFTPTLMMMRIAFLAPTATGYSLFSGIAAEAVLGFIVVTLGTLAVIWVAARVFRVGILMYGKRPTLPEIIKWVRY